MDPELPSRVKLQLLLEQILGSEEVHFNPPSNVQMQYPSIVYSRDNAVTRFAGNAPYLYKKRYQVTVIDGNPDSDIPDKVAALPMCTFNRHFKADNLNHDVFTIFF